MRFLKEKNVATDVTGTTLVHRSGGLILPAGTTAERPTDVTENSLRYNTDTSTLEMLINSTWEVVRAPSATAITKLTLGPTDGTETVFGPLPGDPGSSDNIIVLIENLMQISETNYDVIYSDTSDSTSIGPNEPYADGWYIVFTSAPPLGDPDPIYVTAYIGYV